MATLKDAVWSEAARINEFARLHGLDLILVVQGKGILHKSATIESPSSGSKLLDTSRRLDAEIVDKLLNARILAHDK